MACRFIDSFDHYNTASITEKWTSTSAGQVISAGNGRRTTQSLRDTGNAKALLKTLDAQATWVIGFAFRYTALPVSRAAILKLTDAATFQVDLAINTDGTLSVSRNGTLVTNGTSVTALSINTYYYIEHKVTISDSISANSWKVRVNGTDVINVATGQDSKNTANATANGITIGCIGNFGAATCDFDDLYVLDGNDSGVSGNPCNDFLGDIAVATLYPASAGTNTVWTPDSGSNYARVNEVVADGDTSYVQTGAVGNIDSYVFQNLTGSPASIFAVGWNAEMRKTDASIYKCRRFYRKSGTDYVSGTDQNLNATHSIYQEILQSDPATSAAWGSAALQGSEWGVKLNSIV